MMLERGRTPEEFGLSGYVRAVAVVIGVPPEGAAWEIGSAPAAYVALDERSVEYPERDLMLVWSAKRGWKVCLEHTVGARSAVLARLGEQLVPAPAVVGEFVAEVVSGRRVGGASAPGLSAGRTLGELLAPYAIASLGLLGPS